MVIEVEDLSYTFSADTSERQILSNLDFTLNSGEIALLSGPSGSGNAWLCGGELVSSSRIIDCSDFSPRNRMLRWPLKGGR